MIEEILKDEENYKVITDDIEIDDDTFQIEVRSFTNLVTSPKQFRKHTNFIYQELKSKIEKLEYNMGEIEKKLDKLLDYNKKRSGFKFL